MKTSIQLGRIIGIPIKLHITFLLILPFFIIAFATMYPAPFGFLSQDLPLRYLFGTLAAILLFGCVIAHELSHSYVAMKYGVKINSITLFIFGGIASMDRIPRDPKAEFTMAIAGPGMSIMLSVISSSLFILFAHLLDGTSGMALLTAMIDSIAVKELPALKISPLTSLTFILGYTNAMLFAFNMLPAFPMDGGRLLRAYLAERMTYLSATKWAVRIGKIIAILMGVVGFIVIRSPLLPIIAFIIYIGASEEKKATMLDMALEGVKVRDLMIPSTFIESDDMLAVSPEDAVIDALRLLLTHGIEKLMVTEDGEVVGVLSRMDIMMLIEQRGEWER
jgi:Zn-dependent protease